MRSRTVRKIRSVLYFTAFASITLAAISLLWLNAIGMPQSWRSALEKKMADDGIFVRIERLSYIPWTGIEAKNVRVFSSPAYDEELAHLENLVIDVDKSKALRGVRQFTKLELKNADILIPLHSHEESQKHLKIEDLSGKILINRERKFELSRAQGFIAGIKLVVDAEVLGWNQSSSAQNTEKSDLKHRQLLRDIVTEISQWQWDLSNPPEIHVNLQANINKWNSLRATLRFSSSELKRGDLELYNVSATGDINKQLLTITQCSASDKNGILNGSLDYDLYKRNGHFQCVSSIDALKIARALSSQPLVPEVALITPPQVLVDGTFDLNQLAGGIQATGNAACKSTQYRSHLVDGLKLDFSFNKGDIYLRDVEFTHAQGQMTLSVMVKDKALRARAQGALPMDLLRPLIKHPIITPAFQNLENTGLINCHASAEVHMSLDQKIVLNSLNVRDLEINHQAGWLKGALNLTGNTATYEIEATLPPAIGQPFFVGQPLERILASFTPAGDAQTYVKLTGKSDLNNIYGWHVQGDASVKNTAYRGVPVHSASTTMDLGHAALRFSKIAVDFNYTDYPLRKKYDASTRGPVTADSVNWINEHGHVEIHALRGTIYPAPLLRLFARQAADHLEDYLFHQPPTLAASGVVDVRQQKKTKIDIAIQRCDAMTWKLLGQPTVFREISSPIVVSDDQVTITPLKCKLFAGEAAGSIAVSTKADNVFTIDALWNNLSMEEIATTHAFKEKGYGKLTGRICLKGNASTTTTLAGEGLCSLQKGELFAVPIFGPLSPLISAILGDRRLGFESAKDAFANFTIENGILETTDFETQTNNLKFTGNGKCDLDKKTLDMTIRMNARGILGFLTLPLTPIIKGLFQFQGTGPLAKPIWQHVVFTSPPAQEKKALFDVTPLKAKIVE